MSDADLALAASLDDALSHDADIPASELVAIVRAAGWRPKRRTRERRREFMRKMGVGR